MDALTVARQTVEPELHEATEGLALLRDLSVATSDEQAFAAEVLQDVKQKHKVLEGKRKSITDPLNQALRAVNDLFRPVLSALDESERLLKQKIATFLSEREAANRKALEAAAAASTPAQAERALAAVTDVQALKGVTVRQQWRFQVVAPELVPVEYWSPDPEKIRAAVAASVERSGSPDPIPGVRIFSEPVVTSRAVRS